MQIVFWGVRGSIPVAGPDTVRYGGNSSCIEVRRPGTNPVVLDCGSGARRLGAALLARPERQLDLLFTHFHIDHVLGFPFFGPIFAPSFHLDVHGPSDEPDDIRKRLSLFLNGVFHPLLVSGISAQIEYHSVHAGKRFKVGPYDVCPLDLEHPGGACGYRFDLGDLSFAYVTDTSPFPRPAGGTLLETERAPREQGLIDALRGVRAVVFDTMFSRQTYLQHRTWGHSYPEFAVEICRAANVPRLYLFHHAPDATDEKLDALRVAWAAHRDPVVHIAQEGGVVDLEG